VVVAGYPDQPDLLNATDRTKPQHHDLGSKDYPIRIEHRRERPKNDGLQGQLLVTVAQDRIELLAHRLDTKPDDTLQLLVLSLSNEELAG
jgi:hypothetical protein